MTSLKFFSISLVVLMMGTFATVTYAFAASNTNPMNTAGDGANNVSGYEITNVHYTLNGIDPAKLDAVSFTLNAAAHTVRVKLTATDSVWWNCINPQANDWVCPTSGATTAAVDQLRVAAFSQ